MSLENNYTKRSTHRRETSIVRRKTAEFNSLELVAINTTDGI